MDKNLINKGCDLVLQRMVHTFPGRANLFHSKNLMVKVTLQLLIGQIDAELLKTVVLIIFKSKDVKYADIELV